MIKYDYRSPLKPSKRSVEQTIQNFLKNHLSAHSRRGLLLVPLLNYLEEHGINYRLDAMPTQGYVIYHLNADGKEIINELPLGAIHPDLGHRID